MPQKQHTLPKAVVSLVAPSDTMFLDLWETHLRPLQRANYITVWSEQLLSAGDSRTQIDERLKQADFIVSLMSADFLASDECIHHMEVAIEVCQDRIGTAPSALTTFKWLARYSTHLILSDLPKSGQVQKSVRLFQ